MDLNQDQISPKWEIENQNPKMIFQIYWESKKTQSAITILFPRINSFFKTGTFSQIVPKYA